MPEDITLTQIKPGEDADADVLMGNFNTLKDVLVSTNSRLDTVSNTATSALSGSLPKSGGTMTGSLILNGNAKYQRNGAFPTSTPSRDTYLVGYEICGNNQRIGTFASGYDNDGRTYSYIQHERVVGGVTKHTSINVGIDTDGDAYAIAPTVSLTKAKDNIILTKKGLATWTDSKDAITFVNDLKMCMFRVTGQDEDQKEYTLPITFSSGSSYKTFLTQRIGGSSTQNIAIISQTASKIKIYAESGERANGINVFCIGY